MSLDDKPERIMISVYPEYADKLIKGTKIYEFRKTAPKRIVHKIVLYETKPIGLVTAEAEVTGLCVGTPEMIWEHCKKGAGMTKEEFFEYYKDTKEAVAYRIGRLELFNEPLTLQDYNVKCPPQNFVYLD